LWQIPESRGTKDTGTDHFILTDRDIEVIGREHTNTRRIIMNAVRLIIIVGMLFVGGLLAGCGQMPATPGTSQASGGEGEMANPQEKPTTEPIVVAPGGGVAQPAESGSFPLEASAEPAALALAAGESGTVEVTIQNNREVNDSFRIVYYPESISEEIASGMEWPLVQIVPDWASINEVPRQVEIGAGEAVTVPFTITINDNAPAGAADTLLIFVRSQSQQAIISSTTIDLSVTP
jgi:hypothetical protein